MANRTDGKHESPLPYTAAMVRAVRKGIKTQTRRKFKFQPLDVVPMTGDLSGRQWVACMKMPEGDKPGQGQIIRCRYGAPGDFLWGREAWRGERQFDSQPPRDIPVGSMVHYEADDELLKLGPMWGKLRPPMFMPRWMCRLELQLTNVRAVRLADISVKDAIAEGVDEWAAGALSPDGRSHMDPRDKFAMLWNTINPDQPFESNPIVWALTFPKQETP
jgi:hypothetical protein